MGEKTEKATPKKLKDARKKGQVAQSQDFPQVATFITSTVLALYFAPTIYLYISDYIRSAFLRIPDFSISEQGVIPHLERYMLEGVTIILQLTLPIAAVTAVIGALVRFLMVGPMFATEVFKPSLKKFDIVQNLKGKFKIKTLIELVKNIIKLTVAAWISYSVVNNSVDLILSAMGKDLLVSLTIVKSLLYEVLIKVGLFFLFVGVFDFMYQRYNFAKEMMMEKFEVKQEYKNSEGDPQIKGRRREVAREIAYGGGPSSPAGSKAVVTNPTHIAIGIGYEVEYPAPYIVTKAKGIEAQWIIDQAKQLDIPIMRNIPLAHQLYDDTEEWSYVPIETYDAIAEILKWAQSLSGEDQVEDEMNMVWSDEE